jgi:hypothetical protein
MIAKAETPAIRAGDRVHVVSSSPSQRAGQACRVGTALAIYEDGRLRVEVAGGGGVQVLRHAPAAFNGHPTGIVSVRDDVSGVEPPLFPGQHVPLYTWHLPGAAGCRS